MEDSSEDARYWIWHSYRMMETAKGLHRVADELHGRNTSPKSDQALFSGEFVAVPVLMALAMEIALKAWQCRERKRKPDRGHDLLKLFESLEEKTQARLQASKPDLLDPILGTKFPPVLPGLKSILSSHRKEFERWRYLYEVQNGNFETGQFNEALAAVIGLFENPVREPT